MLTSLNPDASADRLTVRGTSPISEPVSGSPLANWTRTIFLDPLRAESQLPSGRFPELASVVVSAHPRVARKLHAGIDFRNYDGHRISLPLDQRLYVQLA